LMPRAGLIARRARQSKRERTSRTRFVDSPHLASAEILSLPSSPATTRQQGERRKLWRRTATRSFSIRCGRAAFAERSPAQ
jgi:hypothetical protein